MTPTRIQIAVNDRLVAEAILETDWEAYALWFKWTAARYLQNESLGCASIYRADATRLWDVRVGQTIG